MRIRFENIRYILGVWRRFFFFFHWHYSPLSALACRTMSFHFFLSVTNFLHLLTSSTWRSLSTSSFHPFLGLPLRLDPSSSWVKIFLGILSFSILCRWPYQLILCPFVHFTIFSPLLISSSSRFVLLYHSTFFWRRLNSLNTPPTCYIFLTAIGLTPGGSSTVHIYTQTTHTTTQLTKWEECTPCPIVASNSLPYNWRKSRENPPSRQPKNASWHKEQQFCWKVPGYVICI